MLQMFTKKTTFQRMLVYSFSLLSAAIILCVGGWSVYTVSRHAVKNMEHTVEQSANYINQNTSILFSDAIAAFSLSKNYSVSRFLVPSAQTNAYRSAQALQSLFANWRLVQESDSPIVDLSIIGMRRNAYSERNGFFYADAAFLESDQFTELAKAPRAIHIWGMPDPLSDQAWEREVVCLATGIFKTGTNELAGIMRVSLRRNYLTDVLMDSRISEGGHVLILDRSGTLVFSDAPEAETLLSTEQCARIVSTDGQSGAFSAKLHGEKSLIAYRALDQIDWFIVSTAPERQLMRPTRTIILSIGISLFAAVVLICGINILISRGLSRPLIELTGHMQKAAAGDLDVIAPVGGGREIQFLCESFNGMLVNIKALMARVVEEQQNLQRSELKALQEQINPHFLYNSMDSAVWAAENGDSKEVIDLLMSLSNFYKLTLSGGMDIVPLQREIQHARSYLEVLHMRYFDLFDYEIQTKGDLAGITFPKIILQPLAENAIYHGIKERRYPAGEKGKLLIAVRREDAFLHIEVRDNGAGMAPNELSRLRARIASDQITPDACYGLQNVNQRLRLFFGPAYGLRIRAEPMRGCTVSLSAPLCFDRKETEDAL